MENITKKNVTVSAEDGFPLAATVFSPAAETGRVLVFASGLGVPRYAYFKFARYLAEEGFKVVTFDYRGIFRSQDEDFRPQDMRMQEWGSKDLEAMFQYALHELSAQELYFAGHSAGGQILGLAPSSEKLKAAVFLSVTSGHWRNWSGIWKPGIFLFWYLMPLMVLGRSHFPARLIGFSTIDVPAGVTRQWSRWGRSRNYLFDHIPVKDVERYAGLNVPLLSVSFSDDQKLGPRKGVDNILNYFPSANITRKHYRAEEYSESPIAHFGFFKDKFSDTLWKEVGEWILSQ
ncbi:MAG: alpha/beta fold hydrolase [Balneolaceae bacterium]|nr:alpha/beta fold hydrolase [Balneolaceae bacterium]